MRRDAAMVVIFAMVALTGLPLPQAAAQPPADLSARLTRTNAGGGITVKAIFAVPEYFQAAGKTDSAARFRPESNIVIVLALDTHSGDLRSFDPAQAAALRIDGGTPVLPARWEVINDSSHHREGALLFPKTDGSGKNLLGGAKSVELVMRGLGGATERVLRWDLPLW